MNPAVISLETVIGLFAAILVGQFWLAHSVVTDEDLEARFENHNERYHK